MLTLRSRRGNEALIFFLLLSLPLHAAQPSFIRDIAPILRDKCLTCHGPEKAKGEYRLDTFEHMQRPGASGAAPIVPGAPGKSHLYELLATTDEDNRMPQKDDPLPKEQIQLFAQWIKAGASYDAPDSKMPLASLAAFLEQPPPPDTYRANVPVTALAFHPDGKQLAVSGYHEVTLWSVETGALLRRITNMAQRTFALAYNHDGTLLATASGTPGKLGESKLFDAISGKLLRTAAATPDLLLSVVFDPQSTRLACAGADAAIRVFDAASGTLRLTVEQHADWVTGVHFSPDGSNIVSSSRDKTVRVFDSTTGELETTYTGHTEPVFAAVFSGDGKHVFSAGRDKELHVWEAKDAKKISEIEIGAEIQRLIVSTNAVFVAAEKVVHQYSAAAKPERIRSFAGHRDLVYSLAIHEASGQLATGSYDGEVRIWDLSSGDLKLKFTAAPLRLSSR